MDSGILSHDVATPRLGFGCASLLRVPSGRERQRLLGVAFNAGVRHFDVARMYGLGAAERELGRFIGGRRDEVVVATKFGINLGVTQHFARFQAPVRQVAAAIPPLRRALRQGARSMVMPRAYDPATARASLETSLRELRTDRIDLLLLHEPHPGDPGLDDIAGYLDAAVRDGTIGAWGVSGQHPESTCVFDALRSSATVLQLRHDILDGTLEAFVVPGHPLITYGTLSRVLPEILRRAAR